MDRSRACNILAVFFSVFHGIHSARSASRTISSKNDANEMNALSDGYRRTEEKSYLVALIFKKKRGEFHCACASAPSF